MKFAATVLLIAMFCPMLARAEPLKMVLATGKEITWEVEVASHEADREHGLMGRDVLPPRTGMLFVFDEVSQPFFWMKDTRIALDMVYLGADGVVKGVYANAKPYDLTPIPAPEPVLAVLEIAGGQAKTLGISRGAKVIHKVFEKDLK